MKERDFSIDFVKALAVVFVILHHVVDFGPTMSDNAGNSLRLVWYFVHTISLTCVNLFALTTGYLCVNLNHSLKRLSALWCQVFFVGVTINTILALTVGSVGVKEWICAMFPVLTGEYWYFTAYFVLCCFMPFLNAGARTLEKDTFFRILLVFFLAFGLSALFVKGDPFVLKKGYCFGWLLVLYLMGAYWRLHIKKTPGIVISLAILVLCFFTYLIPSIGKRVFSGELGQWFGEFTPIQYTSPFTVAMTLAIFGLCRKLKKGDLAFFRNLICSISSKSLGIYLWLVHPVFWHMVWRPRLRAIEIKTITDFAIYLVCITVCSLFLAWLLECARQWLFAFLSGIWNQHVSRRMAAEKQKGAVAPSH